MVWSMLYISDHLLAKVLMASCTITATCIMAIDIEDPGSLFLIDNISRLLIKQSIHVFACVLQFTKVSKRTTKIPERNGSIGTYDMWFKALVPPVGYSTYFVIPAKSYRGPTKKQVFRSAGKDSVISNEVCAIEITIAMLLCWAAFSYRWL